MHFFIDRNVPVALAPMLGHYDREHTVIYHDDQFEKTTPDVEWPTAVAEWDPVPVVISGDGKILRNPAELQVLRGLPLSFFLFKSGWLNIAWREQAWKAIKIWPAVVAEAERVRRPTVFEISVSAMKVQPIGPTSELGAGKRRR